MRPNQSFLRKSGWLPAYLIVTVFSFFIIYSCNNEEKEPKKVMTTTTLKTGYINASCFELPKSKIQSAWVDPGHLNNINYVAFITSWDPVTDVFGVQAIAYDISNNSLGGPITLAKGNNCAIQLPPLAIGENTISMTELGITNGGQLIEFDYLLVTPKRFVAPSGPTPPGDYLGYDVKVIGGVVTGPEKVTLPCPPCQYCKPPCDTIIANDTLFIP